MGRTCSRRRWNGRVWPDMSDARSGPAAILERVPIFSGLDDAELAFLADRTTHRQCSPGEMLFSEGEPCTGLYVVERGHIRIFKISASGREQVLSIDGPGGSI